MDIDHHMAPFLLKGDDNCGLTCPPPPTLAELTAARLQVATADALIFSADLPTLKSAAVLGRERLLSLLIPHRVINRDVVLYLSLQRWLPGAEAGIDCRPWVSDPLDPRPYSMHWGLRVTNYAGMIAACLVLTDTDTRDLKLSATGLVHARAEPTYVKLAPSGDTFRFSFEPLARALSSLPKHKHATTEGSEPCHLPLVPRALAGSGTTTDTEVVEVPSGPCAGEPSLSALVVTSLWSRPFVAAVTALPSLRSIAVAKPEQVDLTVPHPNLLHLVADDIDAPCAVPRDLHRTCPVLQSVRISCATGEAGAATLASLAQCTTLTSVKTSNRSCLPAAGVGSLGALPALRSLDLQWPEVGPCCSALGDLRKLRQLSLRNPTNENASPNSWKFLAALSLDSIAFSGQPAAETLPFLESTHLKRISLQRVSVDATDLVALLERSRSCTSLDLAQVSLSDSTAAAAVTTAIGMMPSLNQLSLTRGSIEGSALEHLLPAANLHSITVIRLPLTDTAVARFSRLPKLHTLRLHAVSQLTQSGFVAFADTRQNEPVAPIRVVDLSFAGSISWQSVLPFAALRTLEHFSMRGGQGLETAAVAEFAQQLVSPHAASISMNDARLTGDALLTARSPV